MSESISRAEFEAGITRLTEFLKGQFQQVDARFEQIDARFEQIDARFEETYARIEQVETALLTEFHKWARPHEIRIRSSESLVGAFSERLGLLEDRISEIERKVSLPKRPPAA